MSFLARRLGSVGLSALGGAAIGGTIGGIIGGTEGAIGGAVGLGMFGGLNMGYKTLKRAMGVRGAAGFLTQTLGTVGDLGVRATSRLGNRGAFNLARRANAGLTSAASFIGRNQVAVNKYGGLALGAIGIGASIHMGSSTMRSNRGY